MAVEAFRVRNLHAAEDELAPGDQLMNVIADANVNHAPTVKLFRATKKEISIEKSNSPRQTSPIFSLKKFFKLAAARRNQRVLHFLHIGKTGGTAVKAALQPHTQDGPFFIFLHEHETFLKDLLPGERAIFFLRDPVTRFVSGFNSRLRQGKPRYSVPWTPAEKIIFERFATPNALALALSSENAEERAAAESAMRGIRHVREHFAQWFGSETDFLTRLPDIFFIGFQETLAEDFEKLKTKLGLPAGILLPTGEVAAHKTPENFDKKLSSPAVENLQRWYRDDIRFYQLCQKLVAENKIG